MNGDFPILAFFEFAHLPARLQEISREFHVLAHAIANRGGQAQEIAAALRKLLEAKDCAVRAALT